MGSCSCFSSTSAAEHYPARPQLAPGALLGQQLRAEQQLSVQPEDIPSTELFRNTHSRNWLLRFF